MILETRVEKIPNVTVEVIKIRKEGQLFDGFLRVVQRTAIENVPLNDACTTNFLDTSSVFAIFHVGACKSSASKSFLFTMVFLCKLR